MRNLLLLLLTLTVSLAAKAQVTCQAGFTFTTSGLTATFTSASTYPTSNPNHYPSHWINPGSGTPSYFWNVKTHTYPGPGTYPVIVTLQVVDSQTQTIVCSDHDTQYVTVSLPPCAVSISKVQSGNTVTFTANNLAGTAGMTYNWNFGDGNTGTGSPISHTYTVGGNFTVTLTGSSTSANCSKTTTTTVNISSIPQNKITGIIVGDSTATDTFKVWLIQFDSTTNNLYAVDSQIAANGFTSYAQYAFMNKPAGAYRVKAHLLNGPTSGTGYLPTYHQNSLFWNTASIIYHMGGNTPGKHIYMQTGTVTSGPGFIGGNVTLGANKGTSNGIAGQLIFLRDNTDKALAMTYTDNNGDYVFQNLALGTYSIYPEDGGYTTTPAGITLTSVISGSYNVHFEKHEVSRVITPKPTSINNVANNAIMHIYPNPTSGILKLDLGAISGKVAVSIADMTGRKVYSQQLQITGAQESINLSNLRPGQYFITVEADGKVSTQKFMLEK